MYTLFLEKHRTPFVQSCVNDILNERGEQLRALGYITMIEPTIDEALSACLSGLQQGWDEVLKWARQRMAVRMRQGVTLEDVLTCINVFRRHCVRLSLPAISGRVAGAEEGLADLLAALDMLTEVVAEVYDFQMQCVQSELLLREQEFCTFYAIAEHAQDAIAVAGMREGELIYSNAVYDELMHVRGMKGMNLGHLVGDGDSFDSFDSFGNGSGDILSLEEVERHLEEGKPWQGVCHYRRGDGSTFPAYVSTFPITDSYKNMLGIGIIIKEVVACPAV